MKNDIYSNDYVSKLFDSLASTYDRVNAITSFGFSKRWRKRFINKIEIKQGDKVIDLMCGMGECWPYVFKQQKDISELIGIDLSSEMIKYAAKKHNHSIFMNRVTMACDDVFTYRLSDNSCDVVVAGFGLKTLSEENLYRLADLLQSKLKAGGRFSFIEMSVPDNPLVRSSYLFYLKKVLPFVGKLFLGNPENYKMLGIYTEKFIDCKKVMRIFESKGLEVNFTSYFYGCSSGVYGRKRKL